jgi:hypothetical protein
MPASYQTGISSSPTNLLQAIVTWLVAQGWTEDASGAEGSGWRAHLHKGAVYVNFRAAMNESLWPKATSGYWDKAAGYGIGLYLGTGFAGAGGWHTQDGRPTRVDTSTSGCGMNLPSGSVAAYHFFDDGLDNIIIVVERSPGIFVHMGWGLRLVDMGVPEDFPYFFASSSAYQNTDPNPTASRGINLTSYAPFTNGTVVNYYVNATGFVRVDAATFSGRWVGNGNESTSTFGYTGRFMVNPLNYAGMAAVDKGHPNYNYLIGRTNQAAFADALLLPLHAFILTDPGARYAPLGYPPNVFWCEAVGSGYAAGEIKQIGGLDYMLFPYFAVRKAA